MGYRRIEVVDSTSQNPAGAVYVNTFNESVWPNGVIVRVLREDEGKTLRLVIEDERT